jgi:3-oxoacyl-[acyl-carrier-protein] synthase II
VNRREVVVTGAGLLTPLGVGVEENWRLVKDSNTGIKHYPNPGWPDCFQYLGRVGKFSRPELPVGHPTAQVKFLNRGSLLGFEAASQAVRAAGAPFNGIPPGRRALYIASGDLSEIGYEFLAAATDEATDHFTDKLDCEILNRSTLKYANPFFLLESMANNLFSFLSACYECRGPNTNLASLSPQGSQAMELAFRAVQQNRADTALAVGYGNWIDEIPLFELQGLGLLSKCHSGASSFKPFDRQRDGFIPGEGGAAVLLETAESAARRGAIILGRVAGCGNAIEISEGMNLSVSENVSSRCARIALDEANCSVGELAFITAHGSGTKKGDSAELMSAVDIMKTGGANVPICGLKPYTGHMGAASDIAEIILSLKAVGENIVPATLNFTSAEQEFAALKLSGQQQLTENPTVLSISYGLGGQSSAVVVTRK